MQRLRCGGFKRKEKQMWCWGGECEQQGLQLEQLCGWWCWSQCGCGNTLLKRGTSNDHFHEILPSFSPRPLSPTDCHIFVFIRGISIVNITIDVTHQLNTLNVNVISVIDTTVSKNIKNIAKGTKVAALKSYQSSLLNSIEWVSQIGMVSRKKVADLLDFVQIISPPSPQFEQLVPLFWPPKMPI